MILEYEVEQVEPKNRLFLLFVLIKVLVYLLLSFKTH